MAQGHINALKMQAASRAATTYTHDLMITQVRFRAHGCAYLHLKQSNAVAKRCDFSLDANVAFGIYEFEFERARAGLAKTVSTKTTSLRTDPYPYTSIV